jgi:hypothetical protein
MALEAGKMIPERDGILLEWDEHVRKREDRFRKQSRRRWRWADCVGLYCLRLATEHSMPTSTGIARRFASGTSCGPDIWNLQLRFWKLAVDDFMRIKSLLDRFGGDDDTEPNDAYNEDQFVVDAAVAIVLAGTSVSQLTGQNAAPDAKGKTPNLLPCIETATRCPLTSDVKRFVKIYDDVRHFGEAKHDDVKQLDLETLRHCMNTAQVIWQQVLHVNGMPLTDDVTQRFEFDA